jgi:hypothetical protein
MILGGLAALQTSLRERKEGMILGGLAALQTSLRERKEGMILGGFAALQTSHLTGDRLEVAGNMARPGVASCHLASA